MSDLDQTDQTQQGTLDSPKDAGAGDKGLVKLWLDALNLADKEEAKWRESAAKTIDIYRDAKERKQRQYNILYSNTETMAPALYNSTPIPDVRRRFGDSDPVGKVVSQILERGLTYSIEQCEFDAVMRGSVKDVLLPGRCVARVRYKPHMEKRKRRIGVVQVNGANLRADNNEPLDANVAPQTDDEGMFIDGEEYDAVAYEETYVEHVQWADFRRGPGKTWDEVPWIAFRHYLTREELKKLNPQVGATIPLDTSVTTGEDKNPSNGTAPEPDIFKRLLTWEIWDKERREVLFIAPSYKDAPLKKDEDPLGLKQFFPIPRPILAVETPETLVPVEQYKLYKDQAEELDIITRRLTALTRVVKWRGFYAESEDGGNELTRLQDADDGDLVPSQSAYAAVQGGKSMDDMIWVMPIKEAAEVISQLSLRQEQIKNNIYEIMGVADILRGSTQASETASAQRIKAQWGSLRLSQMQAEVQRYARDLLRLMAEIMAEKFSPETLMLMTGINLPTAQEKQQAAALAQQAEMAKQAGEEIPPQMAEQLAGMQKMMAVPTIEEVTEVLRSDALRCFRVDIETDSTIQADVAKQQENIGQFVQGFASFLAAVGPAVEQGAIPAPAAMQIMKSFSRAFKLPREAVDALEEIGNQPPKQDDGGEALKAQAEQAKTQAEIQRTQLDGQIAAAKAQTEQQRMQMEAELAAQEHQFKMIEMQEKHRITMAELAAKAMMPKPAPEGAKPVN